MSMKGKKYIVAALTVSGGEKHQSCIVAEEDAVIPATHSLVYGPAGKEECERWREKNCENEKSHPTR